jgi:rod shape-determining protein MreD
VRWIVPLVALLLLFQSSALAVWLRPGVIPDLALIVVVLFAGLRGWRQGLAVGLLGGFIESLLSVAPAGVHLVRLALTAVGAGLAGGGFERTSALLPPALVAGATLAATLLATLSMQASGWVVQFTPVLVGELALQALLNAGISLIFLPLVRQMVLRGEPLDEVRV